MIKKAIVTGILFAVSSIIGLYAGEQTPRVEPLLSEKAVTSFIKNHDKLLESMNAFQDGWDSKESQWFESFQAAVEEDPNQASVFLKKNPAPKKLQAIFRKYGFDGKTGILQIMVIAYAVLSSEYGDAPIPFIIHPDDTKLVQKYHEELSELLKPIPVETKSDAE